MDKLIYERSVESIEAQRIVFEVQHDLSLEAFKLNCIRMAHALGYDSNSIKKTFGMPEESGDPKQLKLLLD
jgi:hypothetical protein